MRTHNASPCRGISYKWFSVLTILACTLVLTSAPPWGAFAQEPQQTPPAQAQASQASQQTAAQQAEVALIPVSLVSPIDRAEKDGTALHLSLKDITKLALQSNLDIAIADTNEDVRQLTLKGLYASFDPQFSLRLNLNRNTSANKSTIDQSTTGNLNSTESASWNASVSKRFITGAQASLSWNSSRSANNQAISLFNPQYSTQGSLSISQPLLRNRAIDSTRNQIKIANLNLKLNDSQFRQTVSQTVQRVQNAYWDLVLAIQNYGNAKSTVELSRITVDQNKKKVEIGTQAPIVITQSQAQQARNEISLLQAEASILSAENSLRNYISNDRNADIWSKVIVPTDMPDFVEYNVNVSQAIETALTNRPELENYDNQLAQNDLSYKLQLNNKKWQFDLSAGINANGTAGPFSLDRNGNPAIPDVYVGGLFTSYKTLFTEGAKGWNVGFTIGIPLKNTQVDTDLAQTRISRQTTLMNRTKQEQSIIVEVRNNIQQLNTARMQLETAKLGTKLAEMSLDAENKRLEAGLSQNYLVLQAQDQLAQAQSQELSAKVNYRKAIVNVQMSTFTLLEASSIDLGKDTGKSAKLTFK